MDCLFENLWPSFVNTRAEGVEVPHAPLNVAPVITLFPRPLARAFSFQPVV